MRTRLPILLLTAASSLTGCELLVRFDPSLIDGSVDASVDHVAADVQHPDVPPTMDVVMTDATDVTPMDVVTTDATDVTPMDVVTTDATDVTAMDVQPDVTDTGTVIDAGTDSGTVTDTGTDAGTPDTGTPDTGVTDTGPADSGTTQPSYNGCTYATAVDATAMATPTITFPGASLTYTPSCIRITAGQSVTFTADTSSDFAGHPLVPGNQTTMAVESGTPITATNSGTTVTFAFPTAGAYGFYCMFHASMAGIVYVDP